MRCEQLVSEVETFRQCALDAHHSTPCQGAPDWLLAQERELTSLRSDYEKSRAALEELYAVVCGECPSILEEFDPLTYRLIEVNPPLPKALEKRARVERLTTQLSALQADYEKSQQHVQELEQRLRDHPVETKSTK
jgi:hypothetical protein